MNKAKARVGLYVGTGIVTLLLNVIAWNSTAFCDNYIKYVFPVWVNTYGRLTGMVPFSVGEVMLGLAVVLTALALVLWIPWLAIRVFVIRVKKKKGEAVSKMTASVQRWIKGYYLFFAWVFNIVCLIMTLNCFILYHASTFSEKYFGAPEGEAVAEGGSFPKREYTLEELILVRNLVVDECNRLSYEMERDEKGEILYDKDIGNEAIACMQALGETYGQLAGYYPHPKPLFTSDFFCQQYMCGYYFPFSMEANYNDVMYIMNKPESMCHELAHLREYIFEDEANFISFLACVESDDPFFVYSGYLSVLNYLDNDFYKAVGRDNDAYFAQTRILSQVTEDNVYVTDEEWERINGKALIDTEVVDEISDAFVDTTLKVNGVKDGMISYSRVVHLLLQYYERKGLFLS